VAFTSAIMDSATLSDPANWAITRINGSSGVEVTVASVTKAGDLTYVDLTTNTMSGGQDLRITASGIDGLNDGFLDLTMVSASLAAITQESGTQIRVDFNGFPPYGPSLVDPANWVFTRINGTTGVDVVVSTVLPALDLTYVILVTNQVSGGQDLRLTTSGVTGLFDGSLDLTGVTATLETIAQEDSTTIRVAFYGFVPNDPTLTDPANWTIGRIVPLTGDALVVSAVTPAVDFTYVDLTVNPVSGMQDYRVFVAGVVGLYDGALDLTETTASLKTITQQDVMTLRVGFYGHVPDSASLRDIASWVFSKLPPDTGVEVSVAMVIPNASPASAVDLVVNPVSGGQDLRATVAGIIGLYDGTLDLTGVSGTNWYTDPVSVTGTLMDVPFPVEMDTTNPLLTDPASYTLTSVLGAAPATVDTVVVSALGVSGALSVRVAHSGTTLGGQYHVRARNLVDTSFNPVADVGLTLFARGDIPSVQLTTSMVGPGSGPGSIVMLPRGVPSEPEGGYVLMHYDTPMLDGVSDLGSYQVSLVDPDVYPIDISATRADRISDTQVRLSVQGMTTLDYVLTAGVAQEIAFAVSSGLRNCVRVDTGAGTVVTGAGHLVVSKLRDATFAMEWQDTTAGILPLVSTFRADCAFDFAHAMFDPVLPTFIAPEVADVVVQDGPPGLGLLVRFTLQKDASGADHIRIRSGSFDTVVQAEWSGQLHVLSFVRNMQAGIVTFLLDGDPLTSTLIANVDGVSETTAGVRFTLLSGGWDVSGVQVVGCRASSSATVYSAAWNFLHNLNVFFIGAGALAWDRVLTRRGPLVKGWGDATPATKQDVTVRVAGVEVEVTDVNPYIGEIVLAVPVPLLPSGADVKVDYKWFPTPTMEFVALDTPGLVLDQYVLPVAQAKMGLTPSAQASQVGAADTNRFPYSLLSGPMTRPQPKWISHRYLGFQREYSAVGDSPTTLLLDMAPGRVALPGFTFPTPGVSVAFEATTTPTGDLKPWVLTGVDSGQVNVGLGTYTVEDATSAAVVYDREFTVFPSVRNMVARVYTSATLASGAPSTPDGVFTGVGLGFHDGLQMVFMGFLHVNGVEHVGILQNAREPHLMASWEMGPSAVGTLSSQTTLTVPSTAVPVGVVAGTRFQVLTGVQAGVYTLTAVVPQSTGVTSMTCSPPMPAAWDTFGAKYPTMTFEVIHQDEPSTFRMDQSATGVLRASVSGRISGTVCETSALPFPSDTDLLLPMRGQGHYFWGSLSANATSRAIWSFVRYGILPPSSEQNAQDVVVSAEMDVLPSNTSTPWFPKQGFGTVGLVPGGSLLLRSTSASDVLEYTQGYERTENLLSANGIFDGRVGFQLDDGALGAGDLTLEVSDGQSIARLVSVLYREASTGNNTTYRRLISVPQISIPGRVQPETDGWVVQGGPLGSVQGAYLSIPLVGSGGWYEKFLDTTGIDFTDTLGRTLQATLRVGSWQVQPGVLLGAYLPDGTPGGKTLVLLLAPGQVLVGDGTGTLQAYNFDWDDSQFHTFRTYVDVAADTVTVIIDDVVQVPTMALSAFAPAAHGLDGAFFGTSQPGGGQSLTAWHSVSYQAHPPADAKRTLGVWKGPVLDDINSYELPRTDNSTAPNSWEWGPVQPGMDPAPVIEEMDWRSPLQVRFYRDPQWGVSVFRPDLPPPPYYTGMQYLTESLEPTAAWINVEYSELPRALKTYGYTRFGALDSRSVTQQRWQYVRYRLYRTPTENRAAPLHMTLDQYNVVHSGELKKDKTLEQVSLQVLNLTQVSFLPAHINASVVHLIVDGTTVFTPDQWAFDQASQVLTLLEDQETATPRVFSSRNARVVATFTPGKPVTNTYLLNQPFHEGVTLLNVGTPPYPKSQVGVSTLVDGVQNPVDPFNVSYHQEQPGTLYDALEFIEVDDGGQEGLIRSICEGHLSPNTEGWETDRGEPIYSPTGTGAPHGGTGANANLKETGGYVGLPQGGFCVALGGSGFWDAPRAFQDVPWGQQAGQNILLASGGAFVEPVVDFLGNVIGIQCSGGTANTSVVYPTAPAGALGPYDQGHTGLEVEVHMDGLYTESAVLGVSDTVPPVEPPGWLTSLGGPPSVEGSALCLIQYTALSPAPGPWGGDPALLPVPEYGTFGVNAPVPGTLLEIRDTVSGLLGSFVAVLGPPMAAGEWSLDTGPSAHANLAGAINTHPVTSLLVLAEEGLLDTGDPMVTIRPVVPLALPDYYFLTTSNPLEVPLGVVLLVV
jgi:hypothetical protein